MSEQLIKTLLQHLPRYAEEEGDFYSVTRDSLINALCHQHGINRAVAENTVYLCERLLDKLATLNTDYLEKGEWCFVSFPAQLMANSVLMAMSDRDSRFFATNFWNTQGISDDKKNQQRDVLSTIEHRRNDYHLSHNPQPVRFIHVAWGILKLDDNILFYQREDTKKRFDKKAGDYGLIGGRVNQNDLPSADSVTLLTALQSSNSKWLKNALPETLKRELQEEVGLIFVSHYTFKPWRSLKPYRQVQGTAPNHALTEYYLDIFQIDLTLEGYLFLQQTIKTNDRLAWFSITDMVRGETTDGKIAYIKALYDDFSDDRPALEAELLALPDSFVSHYLLQPSKYGLTIPINYKMPFFAGVLGKEKPLVLSLTSRQHMILLGLATHLRGFEWVSVKENITFYPYGWIEVQSNSSLQLELITLADELKETDLIIENHKDNLFRLSIMPDVVYFDDKLFLFAVKQADLDGVQTKVLVTVYRESFETALGNVKDKTEEFKLTLEFTHKLQKLSARQFSTDNEEAAKIEDTYKKGLHKEPKFLALGLKGLIRREAGIIKFILPYTIT
jgi:8-oxo-dGTP pyrophosphatase MutT (NUDIX family)